MDRVNTIDLALDDDGIFHWHGEPFTGTAFELFPDGQLHREVEMVEGEASGYWSKHFRYDQREVDGYIGHVLWTRDRYQVASGGAGDEFRIEETIWDDVGKILSKEARSVASIPVNRVSYQDLDVKADGIFYRGNQPFTGISFELYPTGELATENEILEGKDIGLKRTWFPSGEPKTDGYTSLSGQYTWVREWFPNGVLQREQVSVSEDRIIETVWNEDGNVVSTYETPRQVTLSGH